MLREMNSTGSKKKDQPNSMWQNPFMNDQLDFLQFASKKVQIDVGEPVDEQLALFKKLKYFNSETNFLPFMNTKEYGEGRYDGRFDNSEFFKDDIKEKLKKYLQEKNQ